MKLKLYDPLTDGLMAKKISGSTGQKAPVRQGGKTGLGKGTIIMMVLFAVILILFIILIMMNL